MKRQLDRDDIIGYILFVILGFPFFGFLGYQLYSIVTSPTMHPAIKGHCIIVALGFPIIIYMSSSKTAKKNLENSLKR